MAAGFTDRAQDEAAKLVREMWKLGAIEPPQVGRSANRVEKWGHGDGRRAGRVSSSEDRRPWPGWRPHSGAPSAAVRHRSGWHSSRSLVLARNDPPEELEQAPRRRAERRERV